MSQPTVSWASRIWQAVTVLLLGAVGARVVWELLEPLVPMLILVVGLLALLAHMSGRRGW